MHAHGESLAGSLRKVLAVYGVASAALIAAWGLFHYLGRSARVDDPGDFDNAVHAWVVRERAFRPVLTRCFRAATLVGDRDVATSLTIGVAVGLYVLHRRHVGHVRRVEPFHWLAAIVGARVLSVSLKLAYRRERPPLLDRLVPETTFSFPSGHSVFAAVFFVMLASILARLVPPHRPWRRAVVVAVCVAMAVLVATSRVWLGVHYPSDVLGGLLLGLAWVCVVWLIRVGWDTWRWRHRPPRTGHSAN
jgi:undecaprenyl-diphosphatase